MVKTGQFTTKCKGDRVIALKRRKITLVGLRLERLARSYLPSHVVVDGSVLCWYCYNGHLFHAAVTFTGSMIFGMTLLVRACYTVI